jgi:hypothetical protein
VRTCMMCGVNIEHRRANALCCSDYCAEKANRSVPTLCDCGRIGVKRVGGAWACQRCLDIEAMNALAERKRTAMRERDARASTQAACWAEAWA